MTGKHDQWMIWLFLAPSLLAMAVFLYWPMVGTLWESFHDTSFISPEPRFVGLAVYQKVMADRDFGLLIANSIV
jgi:multiple sugar transport system permease protein